MHVYIWKYIIINAQAIAPYSDWYQLASQTVEEHDELTPLSELSYRMMSYGREYPFGKFKSAVLTLFPPSSLGPLLWMALALYNSA